MAKEGLAAVPSCILLSFFFLSISLTASQSVPPYYAGSYLESSSGQERGAEGGDGFYYGSPPQHFYYPDYSDSDYLSASSYYGSQEDPLLQQDFDSEEAFGPLELAKGLVNTFNNLISVFGRAEDRQEDGGDGDGGGGDGGGGGGDKAKLPQLVTVQCVGGDKEVEEEHKRRWR